MRRSAADVFVFSLLVLFSIGLVGCGGGGGKTGVDTITVIPTTASLNCCVPAPNQGDTLQFSAVVADPNGNTIANAVPTFASSNPAFDISSGGLFCAGKWDSLTSPVNCTTATAPGTTTITVSFGNATPVTATVSVHQRVDSVQVTGPAMDLASCVSQGGTAPTYTAKAFSNGTEVTSTVGTFIWNSSNTNVGTVDNTKPASANTMVVTPVGPGQTTISATISNITGNAPYVICPVKSISAHVTSATDTSFSVATGTSKSLTADVTDTKGTAITSANLRWTTLQPVVGSLTGSTQTATFTAAAPGTASLVASCSPPTCNAGLTSVYGNLITAGVSGTSSNTAYAASTTAKTMIPIDTSANTTGAAITLPDTPNSFLVNLIGTKGYMGSPSGIMVLDTTSGTVSLVTAAKGAKVLAISSDGARVLLSDTTNGVFYVFDGTNATTQPITSAVAADFPLDNSKSYIVSGSTLYAFTAPSSLRSFDLGAVGHDVSFLANGAFGYVSAGGNVTVRATCDNSLQDAQAAPTTASNTLLASLPNATEVLVANSPGIEALTPTVGAPAAGICPPTVTNAVASHDFGQGAYVINQLIIAPDSSTAFITSDLNKLLVYNVAAGTTSTIALAGGAHAFTGGVTLDSKTLYLGGSDGTVHRIDVNAGTDAQQISVSLGSGNLPDLVAVRPK